MKTSECFRNRVYLKSISRKLYTVFKMIPWNFGVLQRVLHYELFPLRYTVCYLSSKPLTSLMEAPYLLQYHKVKDILRKR